MRRRTFLLLGALGLLLAPAGVNAADGDLDPTFGGGTVSSVWPGRTSYAISLAALPDGALLVGLRLGDSATGADFGVLKLDATGLLDTTFGDGGRREVAFDLIEDGDDLLDEIAIDSLGRVYLFGNAADGPVSAVPAVARLTASGSLDPGFGFGGRAIYPLPSGAEGYAAGGIVDAADRAILYGTCVGGCVEPVDDNAVYALRLLANGAPDGDYGNAGFGFVDLGQDGLSTRGAALSDAGLVLVAGDWFGAESSVALARLDPNGEPDGSFGTDGVNVVEQAGNFRPSALSIHPAGGRIVVALTGQSDDLGTNFLYAFNDDGELVPGGIVEIEIASLESLRIEDTAFQSDGRLTLAGSAESLFGNVGFFFARLEADGDLDPTYSGNGWGLAQFDLESDAADTGTTSALTGGRLVVAGPLFGAGGPIATGVARTESALVFSDGFERGTATAW